MPTGSRKIWARDWSLFSNVCKLLHVSWHSIKYSNNLEVFSVISGYEKKQNGRKSCDCPAVRPVCVAALMEMVSTFVTPFQMCIWEQNNEARKLWSPQKHATSASGKLVHKRTRSPFLDLNLYPLSGNTWHQTFLSAPQHGADVLHVRYEGLTQYYKVSYSLRDVRDAF